MSIEKIQKKYYHPTVKRLVEISEHAKQITLHDQRYYQRNIGVFYPSVTHVLSYFPKSKFFENWIKDVGHNIDIILKKAGDEGTAVHSAIEKFLKGEELRWVEENGFVNYPTLVWRMINRFTDFWNTYKPTLIASECHLFSDEHKFAGTGDLVCEINGENWLLDIKTSNSLYKAHDLQTAAYTVAWNETHTPKITRRGIIWLKSPKRAEDKSKKRMQGDGWEIKESSKTLDEDFKLFKLAFELFLLDNEESIPSTETLPNIIKLGT